MATAGALYRRTRDAFRAGGLDTPDLDARLLLAAVLGVEPERLFLIDEDAVSARKEDRLADFARRRLSGEPVGRLLGRRDFWNMTLLLSAETLEPRPDTEILVEAALDFVMAEGGRDAAWRIADIGTGSGAILLALLSELPRALGLGVDMSRPALATARLNAERAGVASRAGFACGDYCAALGPGFDLVVSNPPYIRTGDLAGLSREVRQHDPMRALDGGADGLDAYRALAAEASRVLRPGGGLLVEIGADQKRDVEAIMADAGLAVLDGRRDLSGRDRVVAARVE